MGCGPSSVSRDSLTDSPLTLPPSRARSETGPSSSADGFPATGSLFDTDASVTLAAPPDGDDALLRTIQATLDGVAKRDGGGEAAVVSPACRCVTKSRALGRASRA